jgi:hypothetical protein
MSSNTKSKDKTIFDNLTQFLLPAFTIAGFALTAIKKPELGLISSLISQVFWLYSGWLAWKKAGQIGIFFTSLIITAVVSYGIINYWFIH